MPAAQAMLEGFGIGVDDVPVLICSGGAVLKKPTIEQLAECLGLSRLRPGRRARPRRDRRRPRGARRGGLRGIGGLDVLVLEATAPGGQAGSSSRIENYLGFPTGVSGQDARARALLQAEKFGAELVVARTAARLRLRSPSLSHRASVPASTWRRGRS